VVFSSRCFSLGHDLAEVAVRDVDRVVVAVDGEVADVVDAALGEVGDVDQHAAVHHLGDQRLAVVGQAEHVLAVGVDVEAERQVVGGQAAVLVDVAVLGVLRDLEDRVVRGGPAEAVVELVHRLQCAHPEVVEIVELRAPVAGAHQVRGLDR
jgi:hypothetical protein